MPASHVLPHLDARADRLDLRDRWFNPAIQHLPAQYPAADSIASQWQAYIDAGYILDQGNEGACTGFGLAAVIHYLNWMRGQPIPPRSTRMLYHLAQFYDEWPGEDYIGSSCRGALKGWHKHGVCRAALWPYRLKKDGSVAPFQMPAANWADDALQCTLGLYCRVEQSDISQMQAAIAQTGAIYASARVHHGWDQVRLVTRDKHRLHNIDSIPIIHLHAHTHGNHAFALIGYTQQGFVVQNSWGTAWGAQGLAILTYDDWLAHGTDAWALAMGVPAQAAAKRQSAPYEPLALPAYRRYSLHTRPAHTTSAMTLPPLSTDQAYALSIVMDSNARVIQRLVQFGSAADSVDYLVCDAPLQWHQSQQQQRHHAEKLRLAITVLSGLHSEEEQLQHIANIAPALLANGVYPLFLIWNNGLCGLTARLQTSYTGSTPSAAQDASIEAQADSTGIKAMWTQMKHNASLATANDQPLRGISALHRGLKKLAKTIGSDQLELHLIAHSAGALLAGHCLSTVKEFPIASCQLITPACSLQFANQHFGKALQTGRLSPQHLHLYMADARHEQEQHTAGVYQGSLLTLISNALEDRHQTPLLGMITSLDADCLPLRSNLHAAFTFNHGCLRDMETWLNTYWQEHCPRGFARQNTRLTARQTSRLHVLKQSHHHASLDQDKEVLESLMRVISGKKT